MIGGGRGSGPEPARSLPRLDRGRRSDFAQDGLDPALFPLEELADCAATVLAADGKRILSYGTGAGYTPLRELIGEWFGVHPGRVAAHERLAPGRSGCSRGTSRPDATVVAEYPVHDRAERALLDAGRRARERRDRRRRA